MCAHVANVFSHQQQLKKKKRFVCFFPLVGCHWPAADRVAFDERLAHVNRSNKRRFHFYANGHVIQLFGHFRWEESKKK